MDRNITDHENEEEILKDFEEGKFNTVKNFPEELHTAQQAAHNFMKRESRINIRVSQSDLNMIKRIAVQEGLPYQTLLASMIHKFATGRLQESNKSS